MGEEHTNASSERIGVYGSRIFREFLASRERDVNFEDFAKEELDEALALLFLELRQKDGTPYQVRSLNTIRYGISRTLKSLNPPIDINNDPAFRQSSKAFSDASRALRLQGFDKGSSANLGHSIMSRVDIKRLYNYWTNIHDLSVLQQKLWFELEFFSLCNGKEDAKNVKKSAFVVQHDHTRGRKLVRRVGKGFTNLALCEQPGSPYCPVASFENYLRAQPADSVELFTVPMTSLPLGSGLGLLMKKISTAAGLSRKYPNTCVRATALKLSVTMERDGSLDRNIAFQDYFYGEVVGQESPDDETMISPPVTVYSSPSSPLADAAASFSVDHVSLKREIETETVPEQEDEGMTSAFYNQSEISPSPQERCSCNSATKNLLVALVQKQSEDNEMRKRELELRQHEVLLLSELVNIQKRRLEMDEKLWDSKRKKSETEDAAFVEFVKAKLRSSNDVAGHS